jgi:bifunctional non-homologous end joining protein LigD
MTTMPARFARIGDRHAAMDDRPCSLASLLELSARQAREGLGDAPWPPHYRKQTGEGPRVAPSRRRTMTRPVIEIGRARDKADALAGLERWKRRHPDASAHLQPADVLVDALRGRFRTWTRIRVNLEHVPAEIRPIQEPLDPDERMSGEWTGVSDRARRRTPSRSRTES